MRDRRIFFRSQLNPLYLPHYDALCALLPAEWGPYSALRSFPEQANLYAKGRTQSGDIVTNARAGQSAHNYGCATDWTLWEGHDPYWPEKDDIVWQAYTDACAKVGLDTLEFERPHNELSLKVSWSDVRDQVETFGMDAANVFIKNNQRR